MKITNSSGIYKTIYHNGCDSLLYGTRQYQNFI